MFNYTPPQQNKFRTKNWVKIIVESWVKYEKINQIRFKTSMLKSRFCDDSDAYILLKQTIAVTNAAAAHVVAIIPIKR